MEIKQKQTYEERSYDAFYSRHFNGSVNLDGYDAAKLLFKIAPDYAKEAIKNVANNISKTSNLHGWSIATTVQWYKERIKRNSLGYWLLLAGELAVTRR